MAADAIAAAAASAAAVAKLGWAPLACHASAIAMAAAGVDQKPMECCCNAAMQLDDATRWCGLHDAADFSQTSIACGGRPDSAKRCRFAPA